MIDVNTGRFVGSRSKSSGARLEDTITKNNLEAVKEVVRQLRLRDIGGIIVIDFIDMANPKNRATVEEALKHGARARPDEDLRRRDLAARARRDDAPERDRRAARDPHAQVPDLRRRRRRPLRGLGRRRRRAQAARAGRVEAAHEGVQGRAERAGRRMLLIGPGRRPAGGDRGARRSAASSVVGKAGVAHDHFEVLDEGTVEKLRRSKARRSRRARRSS